MPYAPDEAMTPPPTPERLAAEVGASLDALAARSPIAGRLAATLLARELAARMEPLPAEMLMAALREEARTRPL